MDVVGFNKLNEYSLSFFLQFANKPCFYVGQPLWIRTIPLHRG